MITFYEIAILLFCICTILNLNLKQLAGEKGLGRNLGQLTLQPMAAQEILISRLTTQRKIRETKPCNFEVNFPLVVYVNVCAVMLCHKAQSFLFGSFALLSTPIVKRHTEPMANMAATQFLTGETSVPSKVICRQEDLVLNTEQCLRQQKMIAF